MSWLDEANEDLRLYRLRRVGWRNMSFESLWREWIERT
jgi:hypothetical protein